MLSLLTSKFLSRIAGTGDYIKRNEEKTHEGKREKDFCYIYNPFTGFMPTEIQMGPQETVISSVWENTFHRLMHTFMQNLVK